MASETDLSVGFSDPFCKVFLEGADGKAIAESKKKTKVIKKTLNPEWNASFTMYDTFSLS